MDDTPDTVEEPQTLKALRWLVTGLTVTMIVGFLILIALFVTRFSGRPVLPALPDSLVLPEGARVVAYTQAQDWYAVVTDAGEILIFDAATGDLRQTLVVQPGG